MSTIYLVRSGQSVPEGLDTDRFLTEQSKEDLYNLHHILKEKNLPQIVFHSDTQRAEQTSKILWPKVGRQKIPGLYTPTKEALFIEVKNFLQNNKTETLRSVWAQVHKKNQTEEQLSKFYELCREATEEIIAQTVGVQSFAIVAHEIIINLVGHFLCNENVSKDLLLNADFKNGEIRIIKPEQVLILS